MLVGRGTDFIATADPDTHDRYEYEAPDSGRSNSRDEDEASDSEVSDSGRSNSRDEDEASDSEVSDSGRSNSRNEYVVSDFGRSNSMEAAIYRAAIAGDIDGLTTALQQDSQLNLLNQLTPRDDTILHIAARLGHHHLVEPIQSSCPDLFKSKNCNDDHPLHLAAAGGHLSIVQSLITNALRFAISSGREETEAEQDILDVITGQNKQWNTPLHMAVKDHQYEVAFVFVDGGWKSINFILSESGKKVTLVYGRRSRASGAL